jgi:hypothetical protein
MKDNPEWVLVCPFLDQDQKFAYGVEFGMLYESMRRGDKVIKGYYRTENEEQIRLAAHRKGYDVTELKPWDEGPKDNGWVWIKLRKQGC